MAFLQLVFLKLSNGVGKCLPLFLDLVDLFFPNFHLSDSFICGLEASSITILISQEHILTALWPISEWPETTPDVLLTPITLSVITSNQIGHSPVTLNFI